MECSKFWFVAEPGQKLVVLSNCIIVELDLSKYSLFQTIKNHAGPTANYLKYGEIVRIFIIFVSYSKL